MWTLPSETLCCEHSLKIQIPTCAASQLDIKTFYWLWTVSDWSSGWGLPIIESSIVFLISLFSLSSCSWLSFLKMAILNSSQMAQCQNRVWPPAAWTMPLRQLPTVQLHTICREQHCRAFGRALPVAESLADCQALHCRLKIALFAELSTNT